MDAFLAYTILGIALGAAYAVASAGLVVTYTTSGIFNFAHGAMAMAAAYLYYQLRWDDGWGGQWPAPIAFIVVVFVAAPLFGVFVERVIMRGLSDLSETTRIVIPIALLLAIIGMVTWIWDPGTPRRPKNFFGDTNKISDALPVAVLWHDVIVMGTAAVLAGALWFLLFRTRTGIQMRAVVDSPELTQLNGGEPDHSSMASWAIGSSIAALAGLLLSPKLGTLSVFPLTLLVVNAYAAAVFGRLRSLPLTFGGAIIIGLVVNYWTWFKSEVGADWDFLRDLRPAMPILVLFIVLIALPQDRLRGAVVTQTRERFSVPTVPKAVGWGLVFVLTIWALAVITEPVPHLMLGNVIAYAVIALSIVLLTGYSGEINLAPLTFAALGAMIMFQFEVGPYRNAINQTGSVWGYLLAAGICALVGALVALPALRLRGLYLGLATFAFAVLVSRMVLSQIGSLQFNIPFFGDGEDIEVNLFTNGNLQVPRPEPFGIDLQRTDDQRQVKWLVFLAAIFSILAVLLIVLRRSAYGRRLVAMKDSPAACATLGMNMVRLKLSVFALSAAMAGFGGTLLASHRGVVNAEPFDIFQSLPLFMLTVVGGVGSVTGALLGGMFFGAAFETIGNIWTKLATDIGSLDGLFNWLNDFFTFLGAALAGIGLARNPSGVSSDLFEGYRPLAKRRAWPITAVGLGAIVGLWLLRYADVIANWPFILLTLAILLVLPTIATLLRPELAPQPKAAPTPDELPAELVGLDRPFTEDDLIEMDAALGLDELRQRVKTGAP